MFVERSDISSDYIVSKYLAGHSSIDIANSLGVSKFLVLSRLRKSNVCRRSNSAALRKYDLNESYFDMIDTEAKAYWLGFLLADGNIGKHGRNGRSRQLRITLKFTDKEHLELMKISLSSGHPINDIWKLNSTTGKRHKSAFLRITSKKLCTTLEDIGWDEFKNYGDVSIVNAVPNYLRRHLLRGLWDGDGWISYSGGKWAVGFCDLHKSVVEWVKSKIDCDGGSVNKTSQNKAYRYSYRGRKQVEKVVKLLYDDATIALERKSNLARLVLGGFSPQL